MSQFIQRRLVPCLFHVAQYVNRKTAWLGFLKNRLGLAKLASRLLSVQGNDITHILQDVRTDFIKSKVNELEKEGVDSPNFYVLCAESMGDVVASEPIARYLKHLAPQSRVHWVVREDFKEVVEFNPFIDETIAVSTLAEGYAMAESLCRHRGNILVNCHMDATCCGKTKQIIHNPANPQINVLTFHKMGSLLASFSLAAGLPPLDDEPRFHFQSSLKLPVGLTTGYVAIHCHSSTSQKDWQEEKWEELVSWLTGRGIQVVEIGMPKCVVTNNSFYVDRTGKRNLQEIAWIIRNAGLFIGVDSGFAHVANAVRVPSIILLGASGGNERLDIYSGDFAHSRYFVKLWAPAGGAVADIGCDKVKTVVEDLM